jgi:hypothetical protein
MRFEVTLFAVVIAVLLACGLLLHRMSTAITPATDPAPGLWQESVTQADGVTVRKIRDTTGGDLNVCYVASRVLHGGTTDTPAIALSIACLPEKKP